MNGALYRAPFFVAFTPFYNIFLSISIKRGVFWEVFAQKVGKFENYLYFCTITD